MKTKLEVILGKLEKEGKGELLTAKEGCYCKKCGRIVTEYEYSQGQTFCCKAEVKGE